MNYDPKKVSTVINGRFITGFADGTFVSFEKTSDDVTPYEGADGQVDYSENPSNSAMLTFTLKHTSPSNKYLESLRTASSSLDVTVNDANAYGSQSGDKISGSGGRFQRTPNREWGKEITTREWVVLIPNFSID